MQVELGSAPRSVSSLLAVQLLISIWPEARGKAWDDGSNLVPTRYCNQKVPTDSVLGESES